MKMDYVLICFAVVLLQDFPGDSWLTQSLTSWRWTCDSIHASLTTRCAWSTLYEMSLSSYLDGGRRNQRSDVGNTNWASDQSTAVPRQTWTFISRMSVLLTRLQGLCVCPSGKILHRLCAWVSSKQLSFVCVCVCVVLYLRKKTHTYSECSSVCLMRMRALSVYACVSLQEWDRLIHHPSWLCRRA